MGLLELLENEDELAFVLGHEVSHAIYRHQVADWYKKAQYYAVVNSAAVDIVAFSAARSIGGETGANVMRGLHVAQDLAKLSANVLMPQMAKDQEDAADARGLRRWSICGYDPDASLAVMDRLGEQEEEAEQAASAARQAAKADQGSNSSSGGGGGSSSATSATASTSSARPWPPAAGRAATRSPTSRSSRSTPPSTTWPTMRPRIIPPRNARTCSALTSTANTACSRR